jgi:hypothetical protein
MKAEQARAIGEAALIWLAGEPESLAAFLSASGLAPEEIRARADEPEFLGFLLDWVLGSDVTVLAFAAAAGLRPEDPLKARAVLAGGELPHWT